MSPNAFERYRALAGASSPELAAARAPEPEEQSGDYEAGTVRLGEELWRVRTARITPTKPGGFVAVWRRDAEGRTQPFDARDPAAGLLVCIAEGERFGVFRFTSARLAELGVTRSAAHAGKRGFRVYPSWSVGLNAQAERTRAAQAPAFRALA